MAGRADAATKRSVVLPSWADELPSEWGWCRLADVCLDLVDCPHSTPELVEGGPYLMARTSDILTGVFRADQARRVSEGTYRERTRRVEPKYGDLLYSREGTYFGLAAEIPAETKVCLGQRMVLLRPDAEQVHPAYLRYWLNSSRIQSHIQGYRDGSVAERLNLPTIRRLPVCTPSMREQRAIAHILGVLDDKIELNRQMHETLEAIARTLFKSWFVDFDPVRAKSEGRDSGLPKPISDLFPDSFEESELGEIPKGWRIGTVNDIAETNAKTLSRRDGLDVIDYIEISEVMRGEIGTVVRYERGAEPSRARRCLRHGDSVLSTVRPDRGAYFLCLNPPKALIASTGFAVLSPRDGNWAFLYSALTRHEVGEELGRLADGGAYPAVRPEAIGALGFVILRGSQIVSAFQKLAGPLFERAQQNGAEVKSLAALRDTLLPKLLSGELRVKDAERIVAGQV